MTDRKILAIIPARGGSKGIPGKNIRPLAGKPLLSYTIEHARRTAAINRIIVSTDDSQIGRVAIKYGAEVIWRPSEISGDEATTESALLHALDYLKHTEKYEPEIIVFLQATSPLRRQDDIQLALDQFHQEAADSLFSACLLNGFVWRQHGGSIKPFSYDYQNRERRQDAHQDFVENGSIYIFKPWVLRECNNRLGGMIAMYEMDTLDSFQVDEPGDLNLIEQLLALKDCHKHAPDLSQIQLLVLDFDGVFTDNRALVDQNGVEGVFIHRGDGWGLARLKQAGVAVTVLSTEQNPVVAARCRKLDIPYTQSCDDKLSALQQLAAERSLQPQDIAFIGNDVNDLAALHWVGHPIAVQDAVTQVRDAAEWVTQQRGGYGAVREVCDLILEQRRENNG